MSENTLTLMKSKDCKVVVHLFGATVTSWFTNGMEQLYLSSLSKLDGSKAVRGGIPIVFPNFGPWENGPQHGFARISWWKVLQEPAPCENGDIVAILELKDNDTTRKMWNYNFVLTYKVILGDNLLTTELKVQNSGSLDFNFTTLLHTYIRVNDINNTTVNGFVDCLYNDKVENTFDNKERHKDVTIDRNIDRVYRMAGIESGHIVSTPERHIHVSKNNLHDTVLWNPWKDKAAAMSDFDDEGYLKMICVEPGYVADKKVLKSGETFVCSQTIKVI